MADAPRILIVTSRYYAHITAELEAGVVEGLDKVGATHEFLEVPGAFEIPAAIAMAASTGEWDGFVALGCVIRGETYHFELVANESGAGVTRVALDLDIPIANAILTTENLAQATARQTEKGRDAARVAVEMALLKGRLT